MNSITFWSIIQQSLWIQSFFFFLLLIWNASAAKKVSKRKREKFIFILKKVKEWTKLLNPTNYTRPTYEIKFLVRPRAVIDVITITDGTLITVFYGYFWQSLMHDFYGIMVDFLFVCVNIQFKLFYTKVYFTFISK